MPKPKAENLYLQLWHSKGKKQKLSKPMTSQRLPPIAVTSSWKTALSHQTAPPTGEMCANARAVKALLIPITTFYYFLRKKCVIFLNKLTTSIPKTVYSSANWYRFWTQSVWGQILTLHTLWFEMVINTFTFPFSCL